MKPSIDLTTLNLSNFNIKDLSLLLKIIDDLKNSNKSNKKEEIEVI